jgi:predicted Zn finger-like uncharacterized protein
MILTCPACSTRYQVDESQFPSTGKNVRCAKCGNQWFQTPPDVGPDPGLFADESVSSAEEAAPESAAPSDGTPETPEMAESDIAPEAAAEPETAAEIGEVPAAEEAPVPDAAEEAMLRRRRRRHSATPSPSEAEPRSGSVWGTIGVGLGWIGLVGAVLLIGWAAYIYRQDVMTSWPQSASLYSTLGLKSATSGLKIGKIETRVSVEDGRQVLSIRGEMTNQSDHAIQVPLLRVALSNEDRRELYHWTFPPETPTLKPGKILSFKTRLVSPPASARHLDVRFSNAGE